MAKDESLDQLLTMLGLPLENALRALDTRLFDTLEQIRLRADGPVQLVCGGQRVFLSPEGAARDVTGGALSISEQYCGELLERLAFHSLYSFEEELKNGYLTLPGGHRVGLCGRAVLERGRLKLISPVCAFHIRISRQYPGAADKLMPHLCPDGFARSLLILSPPGCGKTTMLRDAARQLSHGIGVRRHMVAIADERSEIAGCWRGMPQVDVGPCTDVLDGCPKGEALPLLLRVMTPDVLVCDEIGRDEDAAALFDAAHAGVRVLASAHASCLAEAKSRPVLQRLLDGGVFACAVVLGRSRGVGTLEQVHELTAV